MKIITQLFEILLKKRTPEDIQYNANALIILCVLTICAQYLQFDFYQQFSQPWLYAIIVTASSILAYAVLLKVHSKENRFVQMLTALLGINLIIFLINAVLSVIPGFNLIAIFVSAYSLIISVLIIRAAFSCPTFLAVVILISVTVFSFLMLFTTSPTAQEELIQLYEQVQKESEQADPS